MKAQFKCLISIVALIVLIGLQSCYDEKIYSDESLIVKSLLCSADGSEQCVALDVNDNVTANTANGTILDWAQIEETKIENNQLTIKIKTNDNDSGEERTGEVYLPLSNGKKVCVKLRQPAMDNGLASEKEDLDFIANWYKKEDFYLGNRPENNVGMPWTKWSSTTQVPENVAFQNKPEHGWEVVFIDNGRKINPDRTYFGLYNRYLGKLRIFSYTNATSPISGYIVRYNLLNNKQNIKYAYHSLPIGIPMDRTIDTNKTINSQDPITFQNFVQPYGEAGAPLKEGWKAFDIDLSAYSQDNNFFTDDVALEIGYFGWSQAFITTDGKIEGSTVGTFNMPKAASVSYNGGMEQSVADACGSLGEMSNSLMKLFTPASSAPAEAFKWGGAMFSLTEAILDPEFSGSCSYSPATPGTIELKTEAKIKMTSVYTQQVAPKQPDLTLRRKAFVDKQPYTNGNVNDKPYIGEGVWSLVTAPTYYIVDDVMLGQRDQVRFEPDKDGKYFNTSWKSEDLRYVSFFDPTTVKVNLNTNVIKNIAKVEVCATPVVMLGQTFGYTDTYYNLIYDMTKVNRSMPICRRNTTYHQGVMEKDPGATIKYYMAIPASETDVPSREDRVQEIKSVFEQDHPYGLRGYETTLDQINHKKLIVDPEILYNVNGEKCDEGKVPDILISVVMRVTTNDGKVFVYSHRFLPNIVHVTKSQLPALRDKLQNYSDICSRQENNIVNTLGNNSSVGVSHPMGEECVERSLKVLNKVIDYKFTK